MAATLPINIYNAAMALIGNPQTISPPSTAVSAGLITSGVLNLTVGSSAGFLVGQTINVSGIITTGAGVTWNGYYTITLIPDATHISVSLTSTNAYSSGGTVQWAFPYDNTKAANTFNALWPQKILSYTLSLDPWNALKLRKTLVQPSFTVTAGSNSSGTITLTIGPHQLQTGQTIYLNGTVAVGDTTWDGTWILSAVTATTITFTGTGFTGTYSSGGVVTYAPLMDYSYIYTLPPDCIRVIRVNMISVSTFYQYNLQGGFYQIGDVMPPFKIESGMLLSPESAISLLYCSMDTIWYSPPQDTDLISLLTDQSAAVLARAITQDEQKVAGFVKDFTTSYIRLKLVNAQQGTPDTMQESSWITSRA